MKSDVVMGIGALLALFGAWGCGIMAPLIIGGPRPSQAVTMNCLTAAACFMGLALCFCIYGNVLDGRERKAKEKAIDDAPNWQI